MPAHPSFARRLPLLALLTLALLGGGCKTVYWKEVDELPLNEQEQALQKKIFLGVVVDKEPQPGSEGVELRRILKASPADEAGLKPGDVLQALAGRPVNSADELDSALQEQWDKAEVDLVVLRSGLERKVKATLTFYSNHFNLAKTRTDSYARANDNSVPLIPFFDYRRCEVPVDMWRDYFGEDHTAPVVLYEDLDVIPIAFFSAYRIETTDRRSALRKQYIFYPFIYPEVGTERRSLKTLKPGEQNLRKL